MKLYNKNELTHSRIFFDKQPPIFLTVFIMAVLLLVVLFFYIASISTRFYVISAHGTITTEDLTIVSTFIDGAIVEVIRPEGSFVESGEVLFTVSSGVYDMYEQSTHNLYEVRANHTGYVHYLLPLHPGLVIQNMQTVAEISMKLEDDLQVEIFIPAYQISRVEIGQDVNIAIEGVNISRFGTISGELVSIDAGTISWETSIGNAIYYRGIVSLEDTYLEASNGDRIDVLRGVPVTVRIVYDRETYLNWLLNMLQFRN